MIQALRVGGPWPLATLCSDNLRATPDGDSISLIAEMCGISKAEADAFRKGRMRYGLLVHRHIPIVLLDVPGMATFDCHINIYAEPQARRDAFLAGEPRANMVQCYLVDGVTGILRGIRVLGAHPDFVPAVKAACMEQLTEYPDKAAVDNTANALFAVNNTAGLIASAAMYRAGE